MPGHLNQQSLKKPAMSPKTRRKTGTGRKSSGSSKPIGSRTDDETDGRFAIPSGVGWKQVAIDESLLFEPYHPTISAIPERKVTPSSIQ